MGEIVFWPEKIRKARKKMGMSQLELAKALGVTRQAVSRFEKGLRKVDGPMLAKIATIPKVEPGFFFSRDR
jgi:transcriptional regulator with XRE-family HTH domain